MEGVREGGRKDGEREGSSIHNKGKILMRCFSVAILAQGFKVSHDMKQSPDSFVYCIHCKEHVDSPDPGFNSHMMCRVFLAAGLNDGRKYRTLVSAERDFETARRSEVFLLRQQSQDETES